MDNPETKKIVQPSAGVHVILPDYYSPKNMGLIDPSTSDGRVIFFLPWENRLTSLWGALVLTGTILFFLSLQHDRGNNRQAL